MKNFTLNKKHNYTTEKEIATKRKKLIAKNKKPIKEIKTKIQNKTHKKDSHYTTQPEINVMKEELLNNITCEKPSTIISHKKLIMNIVCGSIGALLLIIAIDISIAKAQSRVPDIFGFQIFQVETGSMEPTFEIGSFIVNQIPRSEDEIKVDDVITFYQENEIITHRVVDILIDQDGKTYYVTKGDNPDNSIDPWRVYFEDVISKYNFSLPF